MIAIVLLTCDRPKERREYARRALLSLQNLRTSDALWLHVADDGSSEQHRRVLQRMALDSHLFDTVSVTDAGGKGYGGSYNIASQLTHNLEGVDLVLQLEDDWELVRPLDLDPMAAALRDGTFNCVRLGYIGFTQELRATFVAHGAHLWLALDPDSPEPHVFAGGPRLETVRYERAVGPWPEGLPAGDTEFAVAHIPESRQGVAWPVDLVRPAGDAFAHIGTLKAEQGGEHAAS